jgi:hypothetical protein
MLKRIQITIFILFSFQVVKAQSYLVTVEDTVVFHLDATTPAAAHADVKNQTNAPLRTIVSRQELLIAPEHVNYFCWGVNCYAPTTIVSPDTLSLAPGEINNSFVGYIDASGFNGSSIIRYCFTNALNPADKSCIDVRYVLGETAIEKPKDPGKGVSVPASYDSYSQTIKVSVNGGRIDILNMLGQKIDLTFRYDGTGMVADASSLKTGYYFLFGVNEKGPWSARVIVAK